MEKRRYEDLELDVVRFDEEDVITTSSDSCDAYDPSCARYGMNPCEAVYY